MRVRGKNNPLYKIELEKLKLEREKLARSRWRQKDNLVDNRLTWLLQSQVILFAAFGWLATEQPTGKLELLTEILPLVGGLVCLVISISVNSAWQAQKILIKENTEFTLGVSKITSFFGHMAGYGLPLIFLFGWGWIFSGYIGIIFFTGVGIMVLLIMNLVFKVPKIIKITSKKSKLNNYFIIHNQNKIINKMLKLASCFSFFYRLSFNIINRKFFLTMNRIIMSFCAYFSHKRINLTVTIKKIS
ncbi:MAG: hypothetical protein PVH88_22035 [Ignavibacteria bacterium]|jgi:hypothetical protein